MSWVRVSAILAGWTVLPALAWTLAHEALRFGRSLHDWIGVCRVYIRVFFAS
jgi:hypothetical protein